jgi:hypothetical protein
MNMSDKLWPNGMETDARPADSQAVCPFAGGYRAYCCDRQDKCGVSSTKRWEETAKESSDVCLLTSLPLIHRVFARGLLWQRQSEISRKWIRVTSRVMATTQFGNLMGRLQQT